MKCLKIFFVASVLGWAFTAPALAQDEAESEIVRQPDRKSDWLILELTNDLWLDAPKGVNQKPVSLGFKGHFYIDHNFGMSIFSIAWGLGISADNVRSNAVPMQEVLPDGTLGNQILTPFPHNFSYEKNKFVTTYLELPLEFRVITRERNAFKLALGFRLGYLLSDHHKIIDDNGKRKLYDFAHITTWRYGVSARVGVGKFALTGFYSLTPLIEEGKGTQVVPMSLGLAFTPF